MPYLGPPGNLVPREYTGQARALWTRLERETRTIKTNVDAMSALLAERRRRTGKIRAEILAGAARDWRMLPALGRLAEPQIALTKHNLDIAEFRVTTAEQQHTHWHGNRQEPALSLQLVHLSASKERVRTWVNTWATLSMHSVARRFERSLKRDVADVLADIAALAQQRDALLRMPKQQEFRIIAPSGGCWVGQTIHATFDGGTPPTTILFTRTFLAAHQVTRNVRAQAQASAAAAA